MFEKIPVPTPFQVGAVNAYLAGSTLVDPGIDTDNAWEKLSNDLDKCDTGISGIKQVLITHPHPDHFGLAARFRERGADIVASEAAAEILRDFKAHFKRERDYFVEFFQKHGVPAKTAETVVELPEVFLDMAPSVEVDQVVGEGDHLTVEGVKVDVLEVDGHAPGELVYSYNETGDKVGLVGDNVLADITPNPFLQLPIDGERPKVLPKYNRSLERLRGLGFDLLLPGHREDIPDPEGRIGDILSEHEERTTEVKNMVQEPLTAHDVMQELFGELPLTEYFPGMSEAIGHLDVLEERGEVNRHLEKGLFKYESRS